MSTNENTQWLEAAEQNFEDALEAGNNALALSIIDDVRDNGFESEAATLMERYEAGFSTEKSYE